MGLLVGAGIALLGLAVGSFLNAYVFRRECGESAFRGRSHCMRCRRTLSWFELIPVFSFFLLGGKCKTCRTAISLQYPALELLTAATFFAVFVRYGAGVFPAPIFLPLSADFSFLWFWAGVGLSFAAASFLLAIAVYDYRTRIIALWPLVLFVCLSLALRFGEAVFFGGWTDFGFTLLGAGGSFLFFFSVWFFSRGRAMGFGDAELSGALFLFLGPFHGALALLISFWAGAAVGIFLMLLKKAGRKSEIPFGPFLVFGAFVAWLWGDVIIARYLSFLAGGA